MRRTMCDQKRCYRKDGGTSWTDFAASLVRDDVGQPRFTATLVQDLSERYEMLQRLRFQTEHDPLTGLPNRTLFFRELESLFTRDRLAGPFVDGLRTPVPDPVDEHIVDALVRLGRALSLTVTAVAIETGEQAAVMRRIGCDNGQGYFYPAPTSAGGITAMLRAEVETRVMYSNIWGRCGHRARRQTAIVPGIVQRRPGECCD